MMTRWHTESYKQQRSWIGTRTRYRVVNAEGKIMINDLAPVFAVAIVAEHNQVIAALQELHDKIDTGAAESDSKPD